MNCFLFFLFLCKIKSKRMLLLLGGKCARFAGKGKSYTKSNFIRLTPALRERQETYFPNSKDVSLLRMQEKTNDRDFAISASRPLCGKDCGEDLHNWIRKGSLLLCRKSINIYHYLLSIPYF